MVDIQSVAAEIRRGKKRMWANAQRDSRPAEYMWRPLFNAAKFGRVRISPAAVKLLWPPYVIGGPLYFCPVVSFFYLLLLLLLFFFLA